jgi:hypothetical protein
MIPTERTSLLSSSFVFLDPTSVTKTKVSSGTNLNETAQKIVQGQPKHFVLPSQFEAYPPRLCKDIAIDFIFVADDHYLIK